MTLWHSVLVILVPIMASVEGSAVREALEFGTSALVADCSMPPSVYNSSFRITDRLNCG
jgi:hypothetical protein